MSENYQKDLPFVEVSLTVRRLATLDRKGAENIARAVLRDPSVDCLGWQRRSPIYQTKFLGIRLQRIRIYYILPGETYD